MSENPEPEEKKDEKDWKNIVTRHIVAWVVLAIFCLWVWSMIKPVLPENKTSSMISEKNEENKEITTKSSETATSESREQKATESTVKEKIPTVVTTTAPTIVNGKKVDNPLIGANVKRVKIIVNGLNVRAAPNMGGDVIGALRKNEIVSVVGYRGGWLYIKMGENKAGFIKADTKYEEPVR